MTRTMLLILLALQIVLIACTSSGERHYNKLLERDPSTIAHTIPQALAMASPFTLVPEKYQRVSINPNRPAIQFSTFRANYIVYQFEVNAEQRFSLDVVSLMGYSGGPNKTRILSPLVTVVNQAGSAVDCSDPGFDFVDEGHASSITGRLECTAPHTGQLFLIVAADNDDVEGRVGRIQDPLLPGVVFIRLGRTSVVKYVAGEVSVRLQHLN